MPNTKKINANLSSNIIKVLISVLHNKSCQLYSFKKKKKEKKDLINYAIKPKIEICEEIKIYFFEVIIRKTRITLYTQKIKTR